MHGCLILYTMWTWNDWTPEFNNSEGWVNYFHLCVMCSVVLIVSAVGPECEHTNDVLQYLFHVVHWFKVFFHTHNKSHLSLFIIFTVHCAAGNCNTELISEAKARKDVVGGHPTAVVPPSGKKCKQRQWLVWLTKEPFPTNLNGYIHESRIPS